MTYENTHPDHFGYENTQADQKFLWSRICFVQIFVAFMCSITNPYEKTRPDQNVTKYDLIEALAWLSYKKTQADQKILWSRICLVLV